MKNWTNLGFWNVIKEISIQFLNKRNERDKNSLIRKRCIEN